MTDLSKPIYHDDNAARKHLERLRWANGRFCPHCGATEGTSPVTGEKHRPGLYYCNDCKRTFTVTVGTLFERSHIALHKWVLAFELMAASKKGISAHQLHRMLGVTYKSAWFMAHRIREAMRPSDPKPIGGSGKTVEVDETYFGPAGEVFDNKANSGRDELRNLASAVYGRAWQAELARTLGVNPRTVRRWASGKDAVPKARVGEIMRLLWARASAAADALQESERNPT